MKRKSLGYILLAMSLLLVVLPPMLAIYVYDGDPPLISTTISYPSSTDVNAPSIIAQVGSATDFWLVTRDELSSIATVSVRCRAMDGSYDSGLTPTVKVGETTVGGEAWEQWSWDAPVLEEGHLYTFTWTVTDEVGNVGSIVFYGDYGDSDGYFTINGIQVTSTDQRIVSSRADIDIGFTVTSNPFMVENIRVLIWNPGQTQILVDAYLIKASDGNYYTDNFYVFTASGAYILEGYIIQVGGKTFQKLSIIADWGTIMPPIQVNVLMALLSGALGVILVATDEER